MPVLALADLFLALVLEVICFVEFLKISQAAGWLFFPLILWSLFASYLNTVIVLG